MTAAVAEISDSAQKPKDNDGAKVTDNTMAKQNIKEDVYLPAVAEISDSAQPKDNDGTKVTDKTTAEQNIKEEDAPNPAAKSKSMTSIRALWRYASAMDVILLLAGFLSLMASAANQPAQLFVFGRILDSFNTGDKAKVLEKIHFFSMCYAVLGVQIIITTAVQIGCFSWSAARQVREVRKRYFEALLRQPPSFYDTHDCGALATSVLEASTIMAAGMGDSLADCLQKVFAFVFGIGVAMWFAWRLALAVLVGLPVLGFIVAFANKLFAKEARGSSRNLELASSVALEIISGIRTVAALGYEAPAIKSYQKSVSDVCLSSIKQGRAKAALEGVTSPIIFFLFGLGLWYGSSLVSGDMDDKAACRWDGSDTWETDPDQCTTGGDIMIAFLSVLFGFMGMLQAIPGFTALSAARSSAAALSETIDLKPAAIDVFAEMPQSEQVSPVKGRIEVDNVTFSYPARPDAPVYRNLSLLIEAGQSVALVGPSGCGKSTMVSLIERFYDVDSGKILLDGVDIQRVGVQWLRSQIGLVSQEPVLFEGSIAWNISLGFWAQGTTKASGALTEETMTSVEAAAKLSNAHSFISEFPEAYNTFVGEKGIQLSGGQKQRVAIARALARDPPILVLDEATSALDTASERLVQAALDDIRMSKKRTTIIIAHRLSTIQNADKIAVISDGAVVEEGQHSALMAREGGAYRALVESQLGGQNVTPSDSLPKASEENIPEVNRRQKSPEDVQNENTPVIEDGNAQESLGKGTKNKTSMRWLWKVCEPEKWYFVLGLTGAALAGLFFPAIGFLMAEFIVVFFNVDPDEMRSESIKWCLVFCGVGVVCSAGTVLRTISSSVITERMVMRVRNMAYRSVLRQDIGWFDISSQHTAGALVSQLGNDCFLLKALTGERAFLSLSQITIIVAGLYVSFTASWQLTLVIFGIIPLIVIPVVIQAKVVAKYVEASSSSFIDAGRNVSEALLHLRTIAALGLEHERMNTFSDLLVLPYTQEVRKGIVTGIGTGVAGGTIILCAAFKYFIGGIFFDQGLVEFGDIMRCVLVLIFMAFGMNAVSKDATDKAEASVAARRIHDLLKSEPLIDPLSESGDAPTGRPVGRVEFSEVSFAYPARKDQQIYKLLSLTIEPGQTVALAGPSGCGKSTLVSLLERFYDVDAGKILLDGRDIRTLKVSWLRRQIGLVSQEPVLFSGSVAWNISLGRNPESSVIESDTDIEEAARRANAHTFIEELPQGYNTQVGERATQLSGGQKQRLAIARAIIRNPPILILDEATSALDATSEKIVQAALDELLRDSARTTIIIAHRLSTIENANKIVVFSNGAVVEEGPHKALMAKEGGMYRALVAHADQGAESSSIKKEDI